MEYLILAAIGVLMGFLGGLLGIGGSIIMIPALVFIRGENQHLYQAAAMMCSFFVAISAALIHKKAKMLVMNVVKWLAPAMALGLIAGVAFSNSSFFSDGKSYHLAHLLGWFMIYVIIYNSLKFTKIFAEDDNADIFSIRKSKGRKIFCGLLAGFLAGLLGLGGGVVLVPLQQLVLKVPLKKAISNSAATMAMVIIIGAIYKNATLYEHSIEFKESLKIAIFVIPGAIAGGFIGGKSVHKLPVNTIRIVFIVLLMISAYKLLNV